MQHTHDAFTEGFKNLNEGQKKAVQTIEGPVMVIAGPGTGKTQVLALRIAHILNETQADPDGILCLTFTNSGAQAMRNRLRTYIGSTASKVNVATFHSFGITILDEFYTDLGLTEAPTLIEDQEAVAICDHLMHAYEWEHVRTRTHAGAYFKDIKNLISVLKKERLTPQLFDKLLVDEITLLTDSPASISSRGATKGQLKQEVVHKIKSLERTRELVTFYEYYEAYKKEKNFFDFDDVLENMVRLVEVSEDAAAHIREKYLYVLVDEHQDSSGVQNEFLAHVWGNQETQNIFVVGDDRQLIFGFGGASLSYFEGFKKMFSDVQVITLTDNYRSTQRILDVAETLLTSSLAQAPLVAQKQGDHPLTLVHAPYYQDEIISAGLAIQDYVAQGASYNDCALLLPKNAQVKQAMQTLRAMDIPVQSTQSVSFFDAPEARSFVRVLSVLAHPTQPHTLAETLFDPLSGVPPLDAHEYVFKKKAHMLTLRTLLEDTERLGLFKEHSPLYQFSKRLEKWLVLCQTHDVQGIIRSIGNDLLIDSAPDHETLVRRIEIVRTLAGFAASQQEKKSPVTLANFLAFIDRLDEYSTHIPLARFGSSAGVSIMTLHASKGLEFEFVWIAHMDAKNTKSSRSGAFTLPQTLKDRLAEDNEEVLKRQIYVAITRAKKHCTISFAEKTAAGKDLELAPPILELPLSLFEVVPSHITEEAILACNPKLYALPQKVEEPTMLAELVDRIKIHYSDRPVSVSLLNNFFECPWKWYFKSFLKLPEPLQTSMQVGTLVHNTIERLISRTLLSTKKSITEFLARELEKIGGVTKSQEDTMLATALAIVMRWKDERLHEISPSASTEKAITCKDDRFPDLLLTGKIDLIEHLEKDSVRVTDFKTGKPKEKKEIEKIGTNGKMSTYYRQLVMYAYLLQKTRGQAYQVRESVLEFVEISSKEKHGMYTTVLQQDAIEKLVQDIIEYDQALRTGTWVQRECHATYLEGNTCPYCERSKIYRRT